MADNSFYFRGSRRAGFLLIHGLTGTPTEMRFVGKGLAQAGFTVLGPRLAGHCGTEADLLLTGWPDWFASVEAAFDRLKAECDHVFACGLSMGAVLALHLAARRPGEVAGLGLYGTTLWYDGWSIPFYSFLLPWALLTPIGKRYRFVESFPYGIKDERLRQRVVANMLSGNSAEAGLAGMPGPSLGQFLDLVKVVKAEMPGIRSPALVLHALEDDVSGISNAHYIEKRLGAPVRKILLDDCYHIITVDRQRHEVVRHSVTFFNGLLDKEHSPICHTDEPLKGFAGGPSGAGHGHPPAWAFTPRGLNGPGAR
ncbi:MAG: alpha/beta fold hydrolase [Rhodospirillales bacterium]|nr:alpha/beta fold hydrolase [Rhodospirillales bacterium]